MSGPALATRPEDAVLVFDGVVEGEVEEHALTVPLHSDVVPSGVGITALELRRMVEIDEERRQIILDYIARNLKPGTDYGTIPVPGRESKPSLFKPGAEKICMLLQLRAEFEPDHATLAMAGNKPGVFAYLCRLYDRQGHVVGEGRGGSEIGEKRGWTINNAIKICEKRAQVDAVLRVVCLSEVFTQDLEDFQQQDDAGDSQQGQRPERQRSKPTPIQQGDQQGDQGRPRASAGRANLNKALDAAFKRLTGAGLRDSEFNALVNAITGGRPTGELDDAGLSRLLNQIGQVAKTPADARKYIGEHSAPALAQQPAQRQQAPARPAPPAANRARSESAGKLIGHVAKILPQNKRRPFILMMAGGELTDLPDQELEDLASWALTIADEAQADDAMERRDLLNQIEAHLEKVLPGKVTEHSRIMQTLAGDPEPSTMPADGLGALLHQVRRDLPNHQAALAYVAKFAQASRRPTP